MLVQVVSGDDVCSAQGLPVPNVLKIDVEGYEQEVIEGLQRTLCHAECQAVLALLASSLPYGGIEVRDWADFRTLTGS